MDEACFSSISAMLPLAMPWAARKPSSVCTRTSKIALPMASTSYFAEVIKNIPLRQLRWSEESGQSQPKCGCRDLSRPPHAIKHGPADIAMIRHIFTVSSGTLASRLLGFARDSLAAALLGAGPVADAFFMAFQLINVIRRMLTEGALNAALVPVWMRLRDSNGALAAAAFAGTVLGTLSAI